MGGEKRGIGMEVKRITGVESGKGWVYEWVSRDLRARDQSLPQTPHISAPSKSDA